MSRNYTPKMPLLLFGIMLTAGLLLFILSPSSPSETLSIENLGKQEYPQEWMYSQRAYPNNIINKSSIQDGISQIIQEKSTRSSNTDEEWNLVGPLNIGGRVTDIALNPEDDNTFYIGTAVGGVFRTTDRGDSWEPIFDEAGVPSIGNIAIAPSNPQRLYIGTGEANGSATSGAFFGNGIYKSNDAGDSWTNVGLSESQHIGRIVVDPIDEDRLFVAATGTLYDKNDERGIYRSTNGGNEWEQVLFVTDSTAAIDIVMHPTDTDTLYAAMWERTRRPWQRDYGGETSAIHRSFDGGDTWTQLEGNGLPASDEQTGRIGLTISHSDPNIIYASYTTNEITNDLSGLYKSEDNGDTWTLFALEELGNVNGGFGWYFGNIRVHPEDPENIFVLGQTLFFYDSINQGWDFDAGFQLHVDHHAMEFSKTNSDFIISGNDGGVYITEDRGENWIHLNNVPITQMYNIEVDYLEPNNLFAGTQDNNTIRTQNGGDEEWLRVIGGDGFHVNVDPSDNNFVYGESQFGNLRRSTNGGFNFTSALNGINPSDRNNWNTPVILSPFNPEIVFYGSNKLYRSDNRAVNWSPISPDLTDGEHPSGSLSYGTLTAIAASYNNLNTIYTGSDDGNVHVSFDGGTNWENISEGIPNRYITSIAISPVDDLIAYITVSGFTNLDFDPHVFKTIDGGQTWNSISNGLPNIPANDIIIANVDGEEHLILATDLSVWFSVDDGASWSLLGESLPMTIMRDIKYHEPSGKLYLGTFGRSMYYYQLGNDPLSVAEVIASNNNTRIFPNPIDDQFTISHKLQGNGTIELFDMTGRRLHTLFKGTLDSEFQANISQSNIPSGIYIVKIENDENSVSQKIIIK